jgi:hypothetical protein
MRYSEFKESNIMLPERILTYSEEAALKARKEGRRKGSLLTRLETDQIAAVTGLSPAEIEALQGKK